MSKISERGLTLFLRVRILVRPQFTRSTKTKSDSIMKNFVISFYVVFSLSLSAGPESRTLMIYEASKTEMSTQRFDSPIHISYDRLEG
jgi:uncharacterized membrane protein YjgN (DUF898 family)